MAVHQRLDYRKRGGKKEALDKKWEEKERIAEEEVEDERREKGEGERGQIANS